MPTYYQLNEMNVIFNIFIIVIFIWLISLSVCMALFYRDYINFRYTKEAVEITRKPGKGFLVPGKGFFAVKDKRKATVNDDSRAWQLEQEANK